MAEYFPDAAVVAVVMFFFYNNQFHLSISLEGRRLRNRRRGWFIHDSQESRGCIFHVLVAQRERHRQESVPKTCFSEHSRFFSHCNDTEHHNSMTISRARREHTTTITPSLPYHNTKTLNTITPWRYHEHDENTRRWYQQQSPTSLGNTQKLLQNQTLQLHVCSNICSFLFRRCQQFQQPILVFHEKEEQEFTVIMCACVWKSETLASEFCPLLKLTCNVSETQTRTISWLLYAGSI